MALVINNNLAALKATRNLRITYNNLYKNIARLSSGLRINSAADDPVGMAIRNMLRSNIGTGEQGIRNASDAVNLLQTAEGAMSVISEKLIKMKELAEKAANGLTTDAQRIILNSEYQAMATEIDRIANSSSFNGVKLLDGSLNRQNQGSGIRVHFGVGNSLYEDYYYVKTGDARATSNTGLRIGGDGKNDIWSAGPYGNPSIGCCGGVIQNLNSTAITDAGQGFAYGYNWDGQAAGDTALLNSKYLAGRYGGSVGTSYEELIARVNAGTQSRVIVEIDNTILTDNNDTLKHVAISINDSEVYYIGDPTGTVSTIIAGKNSERVNKTTNIAGDFAAAINGNTDSEYWAMASAGGGGGPNRLIIFRKDGGDYNTLLVEEDITDPVDAALVTFVNAKTGLTDDTSMEFSLGGEYWAQMTAVEQKGGGYSIALLGRDVGAGKDLYIAGGTNLADTYFEGSLTAAGISNHYVDSLKGAAFTEIQDATDPRWAGGEIRTLESAVRALSAIDDAIERKNAITVSLGAAQSMLEGTISSLTNQIDNLQMAESRISDVDYAWELTQLAKNNILAQSGVAMLAQALNLGNLVMSLINGK
jgi:flagellin